MRIDSLVTCISGTPQFRIREEAGKSVPTYVFYTQADLEDDLKGQLTVTGMRKRVQTADEVITASTGDVVFSLLSGTAAFVQPAHQGYLLTQNYVRLVPPADLDSHYLVYLLNEDRGIRRQLYIGQQGSITMKYTLAQLKGLELPPLPTSVNQELIGDLYLSQLKLESLRKRAAELETALVLETIKGA